jgi:hypothetical protein
VPESEQVPLDRVGPRLKSVIARCDAPAATSRAAEQGVDDQSPGLVWKRLPRRPIPDTTRASTRRGRVLQRHRQRPKAAGTRDTRRLRADARGAAGRSPCSQPEGRRARATPIPEAGIGVPSAVRLQLRDFIYVGSSRSRSGFQAASERPGGDPVFQVLRPLREGGPRHAGAGAPERVALALEIAPTGQPSRASGPPSALGCECDLPVRSSDGEQRRTVK